jgi:outer membrane protein TolC
VGEAASLDMVDAQAALISAERELIGALYDRDLARLNLQRATGIFARDFLAKGD